MINEECFYDLERLNRFVDYNKLSKSNIICIQKDTTKEKPYVLFYCYE